MTSAGAPVDARIRLRTSRHPDASVIIPTVARADLLFDCLASIAAHVDGPLQYEVIVVVNGAADAAARIADRVDGLTIHCTGANVGFAAACNAGARIASGRWLVLLNDDTRVRPGWLDALVATAEAQPGVGAVGSRMLFPDGRLQEAGSLVWADGSTIGLGRHAPGHERTAARRVAYCSACSLLVPRHAWIAAGGLDEGYHPAYYEDVDFCLRLQSLGLDVVYEPGSVVEHHEASSSMPDYRLFLFGWNKRRLARKWAATLGALEPATPDRTARAEWLAAGARRRVLVVDDTWPDAAAGSGLPRMRDGIRAMADAGWAVDLWVSAPQPGTVPPALPCDWVPGPLEDRLAGPDHTYDVVVLSRPHNFQAWHARVRSLQPQAALVYDGEALFHTRLDRQVALAPDGERHTLQAEADRMRALETGIRARVDAVVCVSTSEAAFLDATPGVAPVHLMLPLVATARATGRAFAERHGGVFVAGWLGGEASPNVDALRWFHDHVLPLVLDQSPGFQLFVTGRYPPASILRLHGRHVVLLGVVDDLHDVYDRVRIAVVPTRVGAGVKNKFVEALQYGVPVVSTTVGAEGVTGWDGAARVLDDPEGLAAAIVDLCGRESSWLSARRAATRASARWLEAARGWGSLLDEIHAARAAATGGAA